MSHDGIVWLLDSPPLEGGARGGRSLESWTEARHSIWYHVGSEVQEATPPQSSPYKGEEEENNVLEKDS